MPSSHDSRVEIRLDGRHRRILDRLAERDSATIAAVIRRLIEAEERRLEDEELRGIVAGLRAHPIELPAPDELKRELEDALSPDTGPENL